MKNLKNFYLFVVERNDIETVWRIHIDETFVLGSKDPEYPDPDGIEEIQNGIEEIQQKLNALIDAIEKYRV